MMSRLFLLLCFTCAAHAIVSDDDDMSDFVSLEPSETVTETGTIGTTEMIESTEVMESENTVFDSDEISVTPTETQVEATSSVQIEPTTTVTVATSVAPIDPGELYPYGEAQGDKYFGSEWPQISDTIYFANKVPYGGDGYSVAHVLYNGVFTFSSNRFVYYPSISHAFTSFKLVAAPFWAYFDWYDEEARVYYQSYEEQTVSNDSDVEARKAEILARATDDIRDFDSGDFNATTVLVATWENMRPVNWYSWICVYYEFYQGFSWYDFLYQTYCVDDTDPEVNTFQAVYITDGECGYLLYLYKHEDMTWQFQRWRKIVIGYANGDDLFEFAGITYTAATTTLDTDVGNTGVPGYYVFKVGEIQNPVQRCLKWVSTNAALASDSDYLANVETLYRCPCTLERLQRQWWWFDYEGDFTPGEETVICYAISTVAKRRLERLFGNPLNKMCCYSFVPPNSFFWWDWFLAWRNAPYIADGRFGGRVLGNDPWLWLSTSRQYRTEDALPHKWCCNDSPIPSVTCPRFHTVRPRANCTQDVIPINGRLLGDPHFTTMDGRSYTFNGYGEYILTQVDSDDFMLQGRTDRVVGSNGNFTDATVFVAFAAKESNATFQAELNATQDGMILMVNGIDITRIFYENNTFDEVYDDIISLAKSETGTRIQAEATFSSGITLKVYPGKQNLEFSVSIDSGTDLRGSLKGLMGNFNNDSTDEFITSSGTNLGNNLTERQIFEDFASTWQVTSLNSAFTYPIGKTALDFQHSDFEPIFREEANATLLAIAENICGAGNDTCVFDYLATQDESFARTTLQTDLDNQAEDASLANTPPTVALSDGQLNANGFFMVTNEESHYITVTGSDPDGDGFTFKLRPHDAGSDLTVNSSGVITYFANTSFPVAIQVFTEDSNGGISEIITIPVVGCTGCSGNGDCDSSVTREDEFLNGNFILFVCECRPAWTGDDCDEDFDACGDQQGPCLDLQNCTDLTPAEQMDNSVGYTCGDCPEGYEQMDQVSACIDTNECNETDTCTNAECLNTEGSFTCECKDGYRETDDSTVCEDMDECVERLHDCDQVCVNTDGGFNCTCFEGWTLNNAGECQQDSELEDLCDGTICSHFCVNVSGVAACACPSGYGFLPGNDTYCENIDECNTGVNPCQQICEDLIGSYNCSCRDGFQLARDGQDCEECQPPYWGPNCQYRCSCGGRGTCNSQRGCDCIDGWTGVNCTTDIDECTENPNACSSDQECENTLGNFTCSCITGFLINDYGDCEDIDECDDILTHDCDTALEDCVNNDGSYRCDCRSGFARDNSGTCVDIDECSVGIHSCDHICENVPGIYNCRCQDGYLLQSDRESCEQIEDVCASFNVTCEYECTRDTSTNTPFCICPTGFGVIRETECEDIDECSSDHLNQCAQPDLCENRNGSYICACSAGFKLDNDGRSCTECTGETWGENCENSCACTEHAEECNNRVGCICGTSGFTGVHCEVDIDECNTGAVTCSATQVCENIPGTARCVCPDGYRAIDNTTCEDVDECQSSADNDCSQECTNTPGGYDCSCFDGFQMEDGSCEDVDECSLGLDNCEASCVNLEGRFRCECPNGFELQSDGSTCSALTECNTPHSCDGTCALVDGEEICACPLGQELDTSDNTTCNDIDLCGDVSCEQLCREENSNTTVACYCNVGYQLNSDGYTCTECPDGTWGDECSQTCTCSPLNTELCNKTDGTCTCNDGWTGVDCSTNINECVAGTAGCPDNSTCEDTEGGFVCVCHDGYSKSGDNCIECTENFYGKDCASVCLCDRGDCNHVDGSCDCDSGWTGTICSTDINECQTGADDCAQANRTNWVCFNTLDGFECGCATGYDDIDDNCTNIDECSGDHLNQCNQLCTDTEGSYICSCNSGYELQGNFTCVDIDECTTSSPCDQVCTNTEASYTCSCNTGYSLEDDNTTCFLSYEYTFRLTFPTTVSFILDPTNPLYDALSDDLISQISPVLSRIVANFVRYLIFLISRGSVIVDGTSIVRDLGNHRGTMVEALIVLASTPITIENTNSTPTILLNGTAVNITADSDKCELIELINPCPAGSTCVVSGGIAMCDEDDDDDDLNIPLIVGLSVGIPLLVILIVLIVVICYLKSKNKKLTRVASREGHYNDNISRPPSGGSNGGLLLNEDK